MPMTGPVVTRRHGDILQAAIGPRRANAGCPATSRIRGEISRNLRIFKPRRIAIPSDADDTSQTSFTGHRLSAADHRSARDGRMEGRTAFAATRSGVKGQMNRQG